MPPFCLSEQLPTIAQPFLWEVVVQVEVVVVVIVVSKQVAVAVIGVVFVGSEVFIRDRFVLLIGAV